MRLFGRHPRQVGRSKSLGHEHGQRLAHDLIGRVAEHLLGTRVEVRIGPFGIGRDDGVGCRRGERIEPLFALGYRPLAYYTIRDVGDDG